MASSAESPYYVYLIPEHDARGDHFYTGKTNDPARREIEHDAKRYSKKCKKCHGTGVPVRKAMCPEYHENDTRVRRCDACDGNGRVPGARQKMDRLKVVDVGALDYIGTITSGIMKGSYIQSDYDYRTSSLAGIYERKLKRVSRKKKERMYRHCGVTAEELLALPENAVDGPIDAVE